MLIFSPLLGLMKVALNFFLDVFGENKTSALGLTASIAMDSPSKVLAKLSQSLRLETLGQPHQSQR